jgi:HlyD family secretion protein
MPNPPLQRVANYLCKLSSRHLAETMSDRELLDRFIVQRDEAAFAALVARHGSTVRAVCRRVLGQEADADDAFQATFLILLRKAGSISKRESLASWLHGVAHRVSVRAKAGRTREHRLTRSIDGGSPNDVLQHVMVRELEQWLDQAVHGLPEQFRASFILCCLQGKSYAQAARMLGCAEGTVSSRVVRARERLQANLDRKGLGYATAAVALGLGQSAAPVPPVLTESVLEFVRQGIVIGSASTTTKAGLLAHGVIRSMFIAKIKIATAVVFVCLAGAGVTTQAYFGNMAHANDAQDEGASGRPLHDDDLVGIPSSREGIISFIGVEIKPGEKVPESRKFSAKVGDEVHEFRRLRIGDVVEKGQIIGQVYDALARAEAQSKAASVRAAEADKTSSEKTKEEAYQRWMTRKKLYSSTEKTTSLEDVRGAELTYNRYVYETIGKEEAVKVAQSELEKAKIILNSYQLRSGVRGTVRRIHKREGEAVRALETVVTLQIAKDED